MSSLTVHVLNSIDEIHRLKNQWNDLWERSSTTRPTSRCEFLSEWLCQFGEGQKLKAIVVQQGNDLIAALPLVGKRWMKVLEVGSLPRNDWFSAGDLLVDEQSGADQALSMIATTLNKLPWTLYRLALVPSFESSWLRFRQTLLGMGIPLLCRSSYESARIEVSTDWDIYERSLSKNHLKQLSKAKRRMEQLGGFRIRRFTPRSLSEAAPLMQKAFQIEDSGWKGVQGTSILRTPGMQQLVERIGGCLAERGELELVFLELDNDFAAFEYLWNSKGTLLSYKVGYNERYEKMMPGNILMYEILRDLFETRRCKSYDCFGPVSVAGARWGGTKYLVSQWTFASRRPLGRAVMLGYHHWVRCTARPWGLAGVTDPVGVEERLQPSSA